ncbi:hypothetical protein ABZU32_40040 [Sphaerisporangium sp. NPDC005288]
MPVNLANGEPLAWDAPGLDADTKAMLDNLQANICRRTSASTCRCCW